jgi:lambda repressor-like predicted transcriptional regulator
MDSKDASYYTNKISNLKKEEIDFLKLSKGQITIVKSTLRSVNSTLTDVSENERILSKGLKKMTEHIWTKQWGEKNVHSYLHVTHSKWSLHAAGESHWQM